MQNSESVLASETHKVLWEIQTDHIISARRPDFVVVNNNNKKEKKKRSCRIVDFAVPVNHKVKSKESQKRDKYQDFAR